MTKTSNHKPSPTTALNSVVLFGVDDQGKPKAAQFSDQTADAATKAAGPLQLQVLAVTDPMIADLAKQLPVGRIHANGRGFVPHIRRDLYAKLVAAAGAGPGSSQQPIGPARATGNRAVATGLHQPGNWDEIAPRHVVIAPSNPKDGWYEAVVADRQDDLLTLQWRDNPRERKIERHRLSVGLIYPQARTPSTLVLGSGAQQQRQSPTSNQGSVPSAAAAGNGSPRHWDDIAVGKVVLAKEDGPVEQWWEAITVEQRGDSFVLRWRDYTGLPLIVRQRYDLGLVYPNEH